MQITVRSVADLGLALRATCKGSKVRLDDLANIAGVSKQFVSDVERGKQAVQLGLALRLLAEMGLHLSVDIPPGAEGEWVQLKAKAAAAASLDQKASRSMRTLQVHMNTASVGVLSDGSDLWSFAYEPAWAGSALSFDLAPEQGRTQTHVDRGRSEQVARGLPRGAIV